jgi:predicted transposase/invertase (TIGR01784 family)
LFGEGRHIYTFENCCIQNPELSLGDETTKIILNTKGTMDDVTPEMKRLLDFIDGKEPEDDFTRELDKAVQAVRKNEKWRIGYMTLQMHYQEKYEQGKQEGRQEGRLEGKHEGTLETLFGLVKDGILTLSEAAKRADMTEAIFAENMKHFSS